MYFDSYLVKIIYRNVYVELFQNNGYIIYRDTN